MAIKDGDFELVSYDHRTGRSVWRMYDGEKWVFRTDYPITNLTDQNAAVRNSAEKAWRGDWHRVASIPLNVYFDKLAPAVQQSDDGYIRRFLNDSDNRAWRTKEGRL